MQFIFILVSFVSISAIACPDLAGHYTTCKNQASGLVTRTNVTIEQNPSDESTVYNFSSNENGIDATETMITDSIARSQHIDSANGALTISSKSTCIDTTYLEKKSFFYSGGRLVGIIMTFITKKDGQLSLTKSGQLNNQKISSRDFCQ